MAEAAAAAAPELLTVEACQIEPNMCPLEAPISIAVQYALAQPVVGAVWELVYEADYTNKRKAIALHTTPAADLEAGKHTFHHAVPEIKTEGIKEKYLLQVGLLRLTLHSATEKNVVSINMVSQISKGADGKLTRCIISPLE